MPACRIGFATEARTLVWAAHPNSTYQPGSGDPFGWPTGESLTVELLVCLPLRAQLLALYVLPPRAWFVIALTPLSTAFVAHFCCSGFL